MRVTIPHVPTGRSMAAVAIYVCNMGLGPIEGRSVMGEITTLFRVCHSQ